jgi:hypothetical protein
MSEELRNVPHAKSPGTPAGRVRRQPRYFLLLGSGLTIAAGGLFLTIVGRSTGGFYLPAAVLILGIGMLVSALVRPATEGEFPSRRPVAPRPSPTRIGVSDPFSVAKAPEYESSGIALSRNLSESSRSVAAPRFTASGQVGPGGFRSESRASSAGNLPPELIGPVTETTYVPPSEGKPTLMGEGELYVPGLPAKESISEVKSGGYLAEVALLALPSLAAAAMAPTNARSDPTLIGPTSTIEFSPSPVTTGAPSVLPETLRSTPPHLGPSSSPEKSRLPRSPHPAGKIVRSTRCANCRKSIRDPKDWRRCRDCQHQLCTHCIVEALLAYEEGWCTHCAGLRHLELLSKELVPPTRATTEEKLRKASRVVTTPSVARSRNTPGPAPGWTGPTGSEELRTIRMNSLPPVRSAGPGGRSSTGGFAAALLREFGGDVSTGPGLPPNVDAPGT